MLLKGLAEVYIITTRWSCQLCLRFCSVFGSITTSQFLITTMAMSLMFTIFNITLGKDLCWREEERAHPAQLTLLALKMSNINKWRIAPRMRSCSLTIPILFLILCSPPLPHPATLNLLLKLDNIYVYFYLYLRWITSDSLIPLLWRGGCYKEVTFRPMLCRRVFRIPEDVSDSKTKAMLHKKESPQI